MLLLVWNSKTMLPNTCVSPETSVFQEASVIRLPGEACLPRSPPGSRPCCWRGLSGAAGRLTGGGRGGPLVQGILIQGLLAGASVGSVPRASHASLELSCQSSSLSRVLQFKWQFSCLPSQRTCLLI